MSVSAGALDIAFASGALRSIGFFNGLEVEQAYDWMFEEGRHCLMNLDCCLSAAGRLSLRPVLDALTALQVGAREPVGTGVLASGAHGAHSYMDWCRMFPEERVQLLRCLPSLLLLCRPAGPLERAVHYLRDLMQRGFEDRAFCLCAVVLPLHGPRSSTMALDLCDRLRATGLQPIAPLLFDHGVRQLADIAWQLEALVLGRLEVNIAVPSGRPDHPQVRPRKRASWALAEAAQPAKRQAALDALQADVLAATTKSSVDSRVKAWQELCLAWEKVPFPIKVETVKCIGASLKAGGYHSCSNYFGAAVGHQMRTMGAPIGEDVRWAIKDTVRAITRGLGPSQLKDSFDLELLQPIVPYTRQRAEFHVGQLDAEIDLALIAAWWMLREIEVSNARVHHLYLSRDESFLAHFLVPISKADTQGHLTVRSYACICRARSERLCPWHAADRHLHRLYLLRKTRRQITYLFPDSDGGPLSKVQVVRIFERVLSAAGIPLTRPDECGREVPRFQGHVMRVSGTQFLAAMGLSVPMIQLQGRWSSRAIDRYVQLAPLLRMPQAVREARNRGSSSFLIGAGPGAPAVAAAPEAVEGHPQSPPPAANKPRPAKKKVETIDVTGDATESQRDGVSAGQVQKELHQFMAAVLEPKEMLVVQPRRKVAHVIAVPEESHDIAVWRTSCGWAYGWSHFYRAEKGALGPGLRLCKRCFPEETADSRFTAFCRERLLSFFDTLLKKLRSVPNRLNQFKIYYETVAWRLAQALRANTPFQQAVRGVLGDTILWQETLAKEVTTPTAAEKPKKPETPPKRRSKDTPPPQAPAKKGDTGWGQQQRKVVAAGPPPRVPQEEGRMRNRGDSDPVEMGQGHATQAGAGCFYQRCRLAAEPWGDLAVLLRWHRYFCFGCPGSRPDRAHDGLGGGPCRHGCVQCTFPARCGAQGRFSTGQRNGSRLDPQAYHTLLVTAGPPCPDFSRVHDGPGRSGETGQLFKQFCDFLDELEALLIGRTLAVLVENVIMACYGDINYFSQRLRCEPIVADSIDLGVVHRPPPRSG
ncbi:DNMT3B [Symbiodinium sp. CCMP2592]|nr:DNMT3B [Symbiodinium sp. CCMP2592]CAE7545142.1 DNMT3B [Symbiodinium sp. CCMP2592]